MTQGGWKRHSALFAAIVALVPAGAVSASVERGRPSVAPAEATFAIPVDSETVATIPVDTETVATVPVHVAGLTDSGRVIGGSVMALKDGLDALASGDVMKARLLRDKLPDSALDRHILAWAIAMKGGKQVPSSDIAAAAKMLPDWPGSATLRRNRERALFNENPDPNIVLGLFGNTKPQTAQGMILLARSYVALGQTDAARAVLSPFWRTEKLGVGEEAAIIGEFGSIIPVADHRFRMERMLYANQASAAQRVAALAGARELCQAWIAAPKGDKAAKKLLDAVPAGQRGTGFLFAQARYLRKNDKIAEAAALMAKVPQDRAALVDPDAWWIERRALSRELVDLGDMKGAYKIVAAHAAENPVNQADAEFHAGWYAFRGLGDAKMGARHFARIAELAEGSITRARAYYWLGRAAEAGADGDAKALYRQAADYGTTFYGQLAAQKIGLSAINVASPAPGDGDRANFARREAVNAISRLEGAGYPALAVSLYLDLAAQLDSPGELAMLAALAEKRGNHFLALKIGKVAASRGIDIGALSHPLGVIPDSADISGAGKALAYAIARQESEFNVGAVSSAGAQGLLQLLPGTAREVAKRAGIAYSPLRLVNDAGYNATLGAAFLGEQLGRFKGSYILTFAGYNAGPRRAQDWVARYGDPRGKDLDTVVDWIERIPYTETRSYVQRVMENYQVYKMRLTGKFDIAADLVEGR